MYVACLTPGADPLVIRRAMCGVPRVDALLLAGGNQGDAADWLVAMLRELRRELFLDPELLVLGSVPADALAEVVRRTAELLVECRCENTTLGTIRCSCRFQQRDTAQPELPPELQPPDGLPATAVVETITARLGASPLVESMDSQAKITLTGSAGAGSLGLAAVVESLHLAPRDWHRLATAATIARVIEHPGTNAPLWMEVDEAGQTYCVGPDTFTAEAFERHLTSLADRLAAGELCPDVSIDLSQATVETTRAGRYALQGVTGSPPVGTCTVDVACHVPGEAELRRWTTEQPRADIDWEAVVWKAERWLQ